MRRLTKISPLAAAAALVLLGATFFIHQLVVAFQNDRVHSITESFAATFATKLEAHINVRLGVVRMIRRDWELGRIDGPDDFRVEASSVHSLFGDLQAINWVNGNGVIEIVTPLKGNEPALGLDVTTLEAPGRTLAEADHIGFYRVTPPIKLAQGGTGFVAYIPVQRDGSSIGFLNVVFRAAPLINSALGAYDRRSFNVLVEDEGSTLFGQADTDMRPDQNVETTIDIGGRTWTVTANATPELISRTRTILDEVVLAAGLIITMATTILVNLAVLQQRSLRASEERFVLAMKGSNDGVWDWRPSTGETYFSPRYFEMLGYESDGIPHTYDTFKLLLHPDDLDAATTPLWDEGPEVGHSYERQFRMMHRNGSWVEILSRAFVVKKNGHVERIVGTHVDVTRQRRQQAELEQAAQTDDLTNLRNRRGLAGCLLTLVKSLKVGERLAILHVDLDKFKSINDTLGHDAGDHVLQQTAETLTGQDIKFDVAARVGGDEFLLALRTKMDDTAISALGDRLIQQISQPIVFRDKACHVGASIGVAFVEPGSHFVMDETIADADIALNAAKASGRAACRVFSQDMRLRAVDSAVLASQIRVGLAKNQFKPFLQPQVDMETGKIIGFEALARWYHPDRGVLSASEFVSVASEARLIEEIDSNIFSTVCVVIANFQKAGCSAPRISVNVSTAQLSDPKLVDRLIWSADARDVPPASIGIEVLESTMLDSRAANVIDNIHRLAKEGFPIELDDFGTGHAAIANLRKFPVERIKIDRSFVTGIDRDTELQHITGAMISLANQLGIRVLAEGIETAEELATIRSLNCHCVQGNFVAEPMAVGAVQSWSQEWQTTIFPALCAIEAPKSASA